jgi:hypothetical protein
MDLRTISNELINTALDYVDRLRRLHFVEVQVADNSDSIPANSSHNVPNAHLNINVSCGHTLCQPCLDGLLSRDHVMCKIEGCNGISTSGHVTKVCMLGERLSNLSEETHYGSKIQDLIALVKKIRADAAGKEAEVRSATQVRSGTSAT